MRDFSPNLYLSLFKEGMYPLSSLEKPNIALFAIPEI